MISSSNQLSTLVKSIKHLSRLAVCCNGQRFRLQCRHPLWVLVQFSAVPLLTVIPANAHEKATEDVPTASVLCSHVGDTEECSDF